MDTFWMILGILFMLAGIIGSIVPMLPGPPLSYVALLLLQLRDYQPFSTTFLVVWLGIVIVVAILDYVVPLYGTKKFGGTRYGMWGCGIGLVAGFWMGPIGIIIGPFVGALIGEMLATSNSGKALQAAIGSFIGFLFSTLLKLITCFTMAWYFIKALY